MPKFCMTMWPLRMTWLPSCRVPVLFAFSDLFWALQKERNRLVYADARKYLIDYQLDQDILGKTNEILVIGIHVGQLEIDKQ